MSLVSTWVQFDDGVFYKNPTMRGQGWFICFDDDEPPELVMTEGFYRDLAVRTAVKGSREFLIAWLKGLGLDATMYYGIKDKGRRSYRCFGRDLRTSALKEAVAFFLKINARPPIGLLKDYDTDKAPRKERPNFDCVFYEWRTK